MLQPRWVAQEDAEGCGIAVVAMLTGKSYDEVKAEVSLEPGGLKFPEDLLADWGYALAKRYRVIHYHGIKNEPRPLWPPPPFTDVHLCEVIVAGGSGASHMVVMLRDGSVLDPLTPDPKRLGDYKAVHWVAGVAKL